MDPLKRSFALFFLVAVAIASLQPCAAADRLFQEQAYVNRDCGGKLAVARIPVFAGGSSGAGTIIDNYIHMAFLKMAPALMPGASPLPLAKHSFLVGVENLETKVANLLDGRVVEVSLTWRECDVLVDSAAMAYRFDTTTGRLIAERDLFTPESRWQSSHRAVRIMCSKSAMPKCG